MTDQEVRLPEEETDRPTKGRLDRRSFLKLGSVSGAAAILAACAAPPPAPTAVPPTSAPQAQVPTPAPAPSPVVVTEKVEVPLISEVLPYPRLKIATLNDLKNGVFGATYPDQLSPIQVLKLGKKVPGGVGPDEDIVAYSGLCTHMGCPMNYDPATKIFVCPCHYSHFDAEADAILISGPATQNLPRIILEVEGQDIYAVGVQGLIYGRPHNLSLTEL
ncbi:arsenate reductase (azurin) small subunit [Chloroflexus sp. MS-CIW-1]|jgi:arsenite oxidase small subunit|uniref:arsenate reductase (azurin) small subunit n=1 Tax=unclassified Chloroflexus TaxID=2633855 RepID=UPI0004DF996F|nr:MULTISPECIES: arsenate reductase (azurin) small subunit [unclassified Chloroflexus]MBO9339800.1 arsenate reductase (azurin) small subunit [Chloroflexus sp.]MBO9348500.1 arsenate reductase (azurin) small subunit [Chloroflexus sp.]MDN5273649.1 arsenate reductase (azurin) small subunit [Chloroflexus sp. MS-CIW-1]